MLMLITESPPIGVEPDGILYRTPDELAHTDANTPVAVVIDLASPSLAFLEWVANRTRITICKYRCKNDPHANVNGTHLG